MTNFQKQLDELAADLAPRLKDKEEIPQHILWKKMAIVQLLQRQDSQKYYSFSQGEKFGLSESIVNQLMKFCYEEGVRNGKKNVDYKKFYESPIERLRDLADEG